MQSACVRSAGAETELLILSWATVRCARPPGTGCTLPPSKLPPMTDTLPEAGEFGYAIALGHCILDNL